MAREKHNPTQERELLKPDPPDPPLLTLNEPMKNSTAQESQIPKVGFTTAGKSDASTAKNDDGPTDTNTRQSLVELAPVASESGYGRLIELAVNKNLNLEVLQTMVRMQEEWERKQAEKAFNRDFNGAQGEMPRVIKDGWNPDKKSSYARLETVQETITPIYSKWGFAVTWNEGDSPKAGHMRIIATVLHREGFSRTYQGDYPIDGVGAQGGKFMTALQGVVSSTSYAQKNMLRMIWNLTIGGVDDDGETGAKITPEQHGELAFLIGEDARLQQTDQKAKLQAFLKWAQVDQLENIAAVHFEKCRRAVQDAIKSRGKI